MGAKKDLIDTLQGANKIYYFTPDDLHYRFFALQKDCETYKSHFNIHYQKIRVIGETLSCINWEVKKYIEPIKYCAEGFVVCDLKALKKIKGIQSGLELVKINDQWIPWLASEKITVWEEPKRGR